MQTYWKKTEQERAQLTEADVDALLDIELMTAGVIKPKSPELKILLKVEIAKVRVFTVEEKYDTKIAFFTLDDAQKFLELKPFVIDNDYDMGSKYEYSKKLKGTITQEEVYDRESVLAAKVTLKENKRIQDENQREQSIFDKAQEKVQKVLDKVWQDWSDCRELDAAHKKVAKTFEEYMEMTGGNEETAVKFLLKAYPKDEVKEAQEWLDQDWLDVLDLPQEAKA